VVIEEIAKAVMVEEEEVDEVAVAAVAVESKKVLGVELEGEEGEEAVGRIRCRELKEKENTPTS